LLFVFLIFLLPLVVNKDVHYGKLSKLQTAMQPIQLRIVVSQANQSTRNHYIYTSAFLFLSKLAQISTNFNKFW